MDKEFFGENLLLLLLLLLRFRKLRKSKCKKNYFRRRPPKVWVQNIFNHNLQQNLRILQHSSRHYLLRLSLYLLLLPCRTTLEILLLSQKVVLPPLCSETFFILISLDLLSYLEYKIFHFTSRLSFLLFSLFCIV